MPQALLLLALMIAGPMSDQAVDTTVLPGRLAGEWKVITYRSNGDDDAAGITVSATSTRLRFRSATNAVKDLAYATSGDEGRGTIDVWDRRSPDFVWPGIYELRGQRLQICLGAWRGSQRPSAFSAEPGSYRHLIILERR
jgi:uncharacterized protein (TIGR03067 family)